MKQSERFQRISLLEGSHLTWAEVLSVWTEFEASGYGRAEMISAGLRGKPVPSERSLAIAESVCQFLVAGGDADLVVHRSLAVGFPSIGGILIPDLCVLAGGHEIPVEEPIDAEAVELVVDIVDRPRFPYEDGSENKPREWTYAYAGIPQYLLIDPFGEEGPRLSLSAIPESGLYQESVAVAFGRRLTLNAPLNVVIDSARFVD